MEKRINYILLFFILSAFLFIFVLKLSGGNTYSTPKAIFNSVGQQLRPVFNEVDLVNHRLYKKVPHVKLYIAPQHLEELNKIKVKAKKIGVLRISEEDEVPAVIVIDNKKYKISVRYKGDWLDHLKDGQESFRVKVKKGKHIFNMSKFSIQKEFTRGIEDVFFNYVMKMENIMTPRFSYILFSLNDEFRGEMMLEEHFTKELIESFHRREGIIVALNEQPYWDQIAVNYITQRSPLKDQPHLNKSANEFLDFLHFKTFQAGKTLTVEKLKMQFYDAIGKLRGLDEGVLDFNDVFDEILVGKYLALTDIFQVWHGLVNHNQRFYYNPVTQLLEPIAFDSEPMFNPKQKLKHRKGDFFVYTPTLMNSYKQTLLKYKEMFKTKKFKNLINQFENEYYRETYNIKEIFPYKMLEERIEHFLENLPTVAKNERTGRDRIVPKMVEKPEVALYFNMFYIEEGAEAYIEFQNITDREVQFNEIALFDIKTGDFIKYAYQEKTKIPVETTVDSRLKIKVPKLAPNQVYKTMAIIENGAGLVHTITPYVPTLKKTFKKHVPVKQFRKEFPFVKVSQNKLIIPRGEYVLSKDFVTPRFFHLIIEPGTILKFKKDKRFIHLGPVSIEGTTKNPVVFQSENEGDFWQGIFIQGFKKKVLIDNIVLKDVDRTKDKKWGLTGSLTIYDSDVVLSNFNFLNNNSEDVLNIINSIFAVSNGVIKNSISDSIDFDFSEGTITELLLDTSKGDGLDFSGSKVTVKKVTIQNVTDKCISVGEATNIKISDSNLINCNIGVAVKDGSAAEVSHTQFTKQKVGLMTFQKKSEYASPKLKATDCLFEQIEEKALAQIKTELSIDGVLIPTVPIDVEKIYQQ